MVSVDNVDKIEVKGVPKKVKVTVTERGSQVLIKTQLKWWRNGSRVPHAVNHSTKTLVISLNDMRSDEEGTIFLIVPSGRKKRTTVRKR